MTTPQPPSSPSGSMDQTVSYVDILDALDAMMAPAPLGLPTRVIKSANGKRAIASGTDICTWIINNNLATTPSAAADLARCLVRAGGLTPTFKVEATDQTFNTLPASTYVHRGLSSIRDSGLNCSAPFPGRSRSCLPILLELNAAFRDLFDVAVSLDGHHVDYSAIRGSAGWRHVLVLVAELAECNDSDMLSVSADIKKACLYNLYNVLIFHAKLVFGHPRDLVKRGKFFNEAAYVIAGHRLTSVELEHDVLRTRMLDTDPRVALRLEQKDPRMHFVLNCGAQSCPPLLALDQARTEEMLQLATTTFIDKNCDVDLFAKKVTLSRLFKWFRRDFTPGSEQDDDLLQWIAKRASKEKANELGELMKLGPKVKFDVYNWADNGDSNAKPDIRFMTVYDFSFAKTA